MNEEEGWVSLDVLKAKNCAQDEDGKKEEEGTARGMLFRFQLPECLAHYREIFLSSQLKRFIHSDSATSSGRAA